MTKRLRLRLWGALTSLASSGISGAVEISPTAEIPEPGADQAVIVLVREFHDPRKSFVYVDEEFVGTLDDETWTYATLKPGWHTLWTAACKVGFHQSIELEGGTIRYLSLRPPVPCMEALSDSPYLQLVDEMNETSAQALMFTSRGFASPTLSEKSISEDHLGARSKHLTPLADLSRYAVLYVEDFAMSGRGPRDRSWAKGAAIRIPERLAHATEVSRAFDEVARVGRAPQASPEEALVLRGDITRYRSARIELQLSLIDLRSGKDIVTFPVRRKGYPTGRYTGNRMEMNLAVELAHWLGRCKAGPAPPSP